MEDIRGSTENPAGEESEEAPPAVAPSGEAEAPEDNTPIYTKAQAKEMVQGARIKLGWTAKDLEERETALKAGEQTLKEWQDVKDTAEREAVKDDPEKLDVVKERQKNRADAAENRRVKAENEAANKAASDSNLAILCFTIGTKHKVSHEDLKEAAIKYNLTTEELIEDLAKRMAKGEATPPPGKRPDRGKTRGATGGPSDLSPEEKLKKGFAELGK